LFEEIGFEEIGILHGSDSICFAMVAYFAPKGKLKLKWQSMHATDRPLPVMKVPMRWEKDGILRTGIAYFNSLIGEAIIRFPPPIPLVNKR
jgi:hypothetical protein